MLDGLIVPVVSNTKKQKNNNKRNNELINCSSFTVYGQAVYDFPSIMYVTELVNH